MKTVTENTLEKAAEVKGRKLTEIEKTILTFLAQKRTALSGEDIFIELYHKGAPIGYPTVYVTLRRWTDLGLIKKEKKAGCRKMAYLLKWPERIR